MTPAPSTRATTAKQAALSHLRQEISRGALQPGSRIHQERLAAELECSVIPVREALETLAAEQLVQYRPNRGYQVAALDADELTGNYELRALIEDEVTRIATPRLTDAELVIIREAAAEIERAGAVADILAMTAANSRFHFTIFEAARRPVMVRHISLLWQATDAYRAIYYSQSRSRTRVDEEHREILTALEQRDVDRTVHLLARHREHSVAALLSVLPPSPRTA